MKFVSIIMWMSLVVVLLLFWGRSATAQSLQQNYSGPEGQITGYVIGVNGYPVDWALVNATDGQHSYTAFSGMSGFYLMWVPVGAYNVSVDVQGYWADSATANVTKDSTLRLDFHLKQSPVQVPEFGPGLASILMSLALAAALMISRQPPYRRVTAQH